MERPKVPESSLIPFRARATTRWSDEDNQGVLNNAVYMTLFEEARLAYFRELLDSNQFPFLLAQTNVVFLLPGKGGVEVDVECTTTHVGGTSFVQAYRLREVATGRAWAEAEARLVCYDPRTMAKVSIPAALRAIVERREQR